MRRRLGRSGDLLGNERPELLLSIFQRFQCEPGYTPSVSQTLRYVVDLPLGECYVTLEFVRGLPVALATVIPRILRYEKRSEIAKVFHDDEEFCH